ncbi:ferulic acid esterase feruloyl esterase [Apiospora saccharicola]|uniref:Carboxylic ester hydrolase n=1 Tax=Apiospora saccharicola TaxID=335842 RepID=A0ABR1U3S9_9PEZI
MENIGPILHALLVLSLFPFSQARNFCPGLLPSGSCSPANFEDVLRPYSATIETINTVSNNSCYGEDVADNVFYGLCPAFSSSLADIAQAQCNYALVLPPSCAMIVKMGNYRFGLIMPESGVWGNSFMATGGFSFAGGINWREMWAGAYYYKMAVMSTDQGHKGGMSDQRWAKGNPGAREDWGYRALSGSVPVAKDIIQRYYGKPANHSYFAGCSTSGRQGLKQIQVDPASFDGLLIGAPAWDQEHLMPWVAKLADIDPPDTPGSVHRTPTQYAFIVDGVRNGCDSQDNVTDGVIMDPAACNITDIAQSLSCDNNTSPDCLTRAQASTLVALHHNLTITVDGKPQSVFPGPEPGAEANLLTFVDPTSGEYAPAAKPYGFDWQWPINFLTNYKVGYNYTDQIVLDAETEKPGNASPNASATNWTALNDRGGKVMMYHSLADGIIPTKSSLQYYQEVVKAAPEHDDFMLYYQVPGMGHCLWSDSYPVAPSVPGTPPLLQQYRAPWFLSAATQGSAALGSNLTGLVNNATTDMFAALIKWVETKSDKPHDIITTTFNATDRYNTPFAQRPVCPYPQRAQYIGGSSDFNVTTSWKCI